MRIGVHANPGKPKALELVRHLRTVVGARAELVLSRETLEALGEPGSGAPGLADLDAELLVVFGGDGTVLRARHQSHLPILPVNAGTVGFLAEVDGDDAAGFDAAIERLLARQYHLEERMTIGTKVGTATLPEATNEVVVHTSQVAKMRLFEIRIDGEPMGRLRADGIIVATPTGSTSYALSALGPVIEPTVEAIVVSALAPFHVTQRAVLVEPSHTVTVRLVLPDKEGVVVVDGQTELKLPGGAEVLCYRSPRKTVLVRFAAEYFSRLHGKRVLPWGDGSLAGEEGDDAGLPPDP